MYYIYHQLVGEYYIVIQFSIEELQDINVH
jgi:hypothetical protein